MEIEIRSKVTDLNALLVKIAEINAQKKYTERQIDTYFKQVDDKDRKMVIRIREIPQGKILLTFKSASPKNTKDTMWADYDTVIDRPEILKAVLKNGGYSELCSIDKKRTSYELNTFEINIDTIQGLGDFIEIEGNGDVDERAQIESDILKLLARLGCTEIITKGYVPLMIERVQNN